MFLGAVKDNDPAALEMWDEHQADLAEILGGNATSIIEHLNAFQFDEALAILNVN